MQKRYHWVVALLSLMILGEATAGSGFPKSISKSLTGTVHYFGIGQDVLFINDGYPIRSPYSCPDVYRVENHLKQVTANVNAEKICGAVTKTHIRNTFLSFNQKSLSSDYFIFYFGGYTQKVRHHGQVVTAFFVSAPEIHSTDDTLGNADSNSYFTISDLRLWMNALPPRNQVILIEAGFTSELRMEFSKMLLESSSITSLLENRKRVLLFPQGVGIEDARLKAGRFTWTMTQGLDTMGWNLLDVFDDDRNDDFEFACWKSYVGANSDGNNAGKGINLIKEWELQELFKPLEQAAMRGENVPLSKKPSWNSTDSTPRFFAFLCATDKYQYLNPMSNPVFDATALAKILGEKYGFHVKLIINPATMEEFRAHLQHFTDSVNFGDRDELLVFIAGHGQYNALDNAGYIAFGKSHKNMVSEMQEQRNLVNLLDNRPCKKIMLILDVCFGGMISQGLVSQSDPRLCLAPTAPPGILWPYNHNQSAQVHKYLSCANRVYLTSGGIEYVSDGTPGAHSPFASALIATLQESNETMLLADEVITGVKKRMGQTNPGLQMPTSGRFGLDNNSTDFIFIKKNPAR